MKRVAVVLLLLIANAILGSSKTTVPATAPGKLFQEWIAAFNAADLAALRNFAETRYSTEAREGRSAQEIAEGQLENRQSNGGWDLVKVEQSSPRELTVLLKSRGTFPRYGRFAYKVNESDPTKLAQRRAGPASPPADTKGERKSAADLSKEVEAKLEALAKKDEFSGAVLIAKDGKPVWQKAFGLQDREKKIPANLETRFRIGSMNKMFTSVAIAQLVEAGKLKFADNLADVLPEYPNLAVAKKITVAQLLTHTSGLGDIFGPKFFQTKDALRELKDYLPLFVDDGESNVGDLLRFANALRGYKLLSPEMTERITAGKIETQPGSTSKYADGFGDRVENGRRFVGHNGGAPSMNAALTILWNEGYTVVVLANLDPTVAQDAADYVSDRL